MTFLRKAAIIVATVAMTIGLAGVSSPAVAKDTGWDCSGACIAPSPGHK
jgi:hypothetical protein